MVNINKIKQLAKEKGLKLSFLCEKIGASRYRLYDWERGKSSPTENEIQTIADLLGTTVDYLTDKTDKKEKPAQNVQVIDENDNIVVLDDETRDLIDSLRSKPEMKMLFSVSKNATKEDIIRTVKIIEALKDQKEGEE